MSSQPALTSVAGLLVGHFTDRAAAPGCPVVLGPPEGMRAPAYVRGRATGTRELDALSPGHLVPAIHGLLLTGGAAHGLGGAGGGPGWVAPRGGGGAGGGGGG